MHRDVTIDHRKTLLREAMEVMAAEYAMALALDDVAARIATSRRQLQRCFAEVGQTSFRAALTAIRMHRAAELLATTSRPVNAIASSVGYRQPAQFAKAFRRHYGVTPSDYRIAAGRAAPAAA